MGEDGTQLNSYFLLSFSSRLWQDKGMAIILFS